MSGLSVLIADDETPITSILRNRLEKVGCSVRVAHDGQEAFELASADAPDVVVTDLQMPRWTGLEFALAMAGDDRLSGVPVLLLTARGYIVAPEQQEKTNIRAVISKPFSANEVVRTVLNMVGSNGIVRKESA
ncbi:MAG: response regulator [Phycisphaerales bacterium JB065]